MAHRLRKKAEKFRPTAAKPGDAKRQGVFVPRVRCPPAGLANTMCRSSDATATELKDADEEGLRRLQPGREAGRVALVDGQRLGALTEPPFPRKAVFILLMCNLTEPIVMAVLFPMAPFMVAGWVPLDEVGSWAGLLTSMYNIASIPASVFWGRLSDRVGRKRCMVALLVGSAVFILVLVNH